MIRNARDMALAKISAWITFAALLLGLLGLDLIVHRRESKHPRRSAITWTVVWIGTALAFGAFIAIVFGGAEAQEYLAAYLIEKSLSLDNLFVFLVIFRSLKIPRANQRTVLSWGIFGALLFRAIFILTGVAAVERFHEIVYVFAGILIWACVRALREDPTKERDMKTARWLARHLPLTATIAGNRFLTKEGGKRVATPLLLAVVAVELTDIAFAIDSVPAALAITRDRFLIYSSNAFALLGLRSLYVALEASLTRASNLRYGVAAVLAFAAIKIILSPWVAIPLFLSVAIILSCIAAPVLLAALGRRRPRTPMPRPS